MSAEYRIEAVRERYFVIDPSGELAAVYSSEEAARENIERFKKQDAGCHGYSVCGRRENGRGATDSR